MTLSDESALQASSARKQHGNVTDEDLLYPAQEREPWGQCVTSEYGDFKGIGYEYIDNGVLWRRWFLRNGSVLLYVTYNAPPAVAVKERGAVQRVLATARAESTSEALYLPNDRS